MFFKKEKSFFQRGDFLYTLTIKDMSIGVDFEAGVIDRLMLGGEDRIADRVPLFTVRLRNRAGEKIYLDPSMAQACCVDADGALYSDFQSASDAEAVKDVAVRVLLAEEAGEAAWHISVSVGSADLLCEWVDFVRLSLPCPIENDVRGGEILLPYNEGVLVRALEENEAAASRHKEPEYPSMGIYSMFPHMMSSQMLAYLWGNICFYYGVHDPSRAPKGIDYLPEGNGVILRMRLFCGVDFGEAFVPDYPIVWAVLSGGWEAAAERYRTWIEKNLPPRTAKIAENKKLPAWYEDSPLVVAYAVRGWYDTDEMSLNALYPYTNALPLLNQIKARTGARIMALLMHWEGTAPWAPPYVWPPYGDGENFSDFMHTLHQNGDLLGVYCSGFGYTLQSKLVKEYNREEELVQKGYLAGMCADFGDEVAISKICTAQRRGYDICAASPVGRELLDRAYRPLLESGVDYAQILDQNHGGAQYFCYSSKHGHPPAPGAWMTSQMQDMLSGWNDLAPEMLFGCESAAAEPFIGNLQFSDNRFELNYRNGRAVPLYSYLYHEYLRNFMGNQVACPIDAESLAYRVAYSFAAGDSMSLVLAPNGQILSRWGTRDFSDAVNGEKILTLVSNLTAFYNAYAKPYLWAGRMITPPAMDCESIVLGYLNSDKTLSVPALHCTAWQAPNGDRACILVNPNERDVECKLAGETIIVPALNATIRNLA